MSLFSFFYVSDVHEIKTVDWKEWSETVLVERQTPTETENYYVVLYISTFVKDRSIKDQPGFIRCESHLIKSGTSCDTCHL